MIDDPRWTELKGEMIERSEEPADPKIVIIEGADMEYLKRAIGLHPMIYRLRVSIHPDGVKFKVNEDMWTPLLGKEA